MRNAAAVVLAITLVIFPDYASAEAIVKPSGRQATIGLEAERVRAPKASADSQPASTGSAAVGGAQEPAFDPVDTCRVDAELGIYGCRDVEPADEDEPEEGRELTEGDILRAVQEIGLPSLAVRVEPGTSTLVNAETNFFTRPQAFARSIDLLGFDIDLEASPVRYLWVHGDGTRAATTEPGRPYPNLDVTHRYREPAEVVRPRVDVTYRVRYRVDGGAWATLGQTLTATGPFADLEVSEAAPVLTAP